jgi:hypothetical protein
VLLACAASYPFVCMCVLLLCVCARWCCVACMSAVMLCKGSQPQHNIARVAVCTPLAGSCVLPAVVAWRPVTGLAGPHTAAEACCVLAWAPSWCTARLHRGNWVSSGAVLDVGQSSCNVLQWRWLCCGRGVACWFIPEIVYERRAVRVVMAHTVLTLAAIGAASCCCMQGCCGVLHGLSMEACISNTSALEVKGLKGATPLRYPCMFHVCFGVVCS